MPRGIKTRDTRILARNLRVGDDFFEGEAIEEIRFTDKGNVSFRLASGVWRRRPADEKVPVQRRV